MSKIEELRAAHQYFEYLWFARDAGDTYSIGSGDDIIATSTSESLARFTVCAHNLMPTLLEAVEALEKMRTSFEDLLNGYPERELHEPYQVTLNRAHSILEKLK